MITPLQPMFEQLTAEGAWKTACDILLLKSDFDAGFRDAFHEHWTVAGHHMRAQIDDDKRLVKLLRSILPIYVGPGRTLFRGEKNDRWTSRNVGLCWSDEVRTAEMFGRGLHATGAGGGVLLKCYASERAIISGPSGHSHHLGESEYTLDISQASEIEVIERYPSLDLL